MRPEPDTYWLARIEPRDELAVHLIPWKGSHAFCGVDVWEPRNVEPVDNSDYLTIAEFIEGLRKGEIEVGDLTCSRCIPALAIRFRETNDNS